MKKNKKLIMTMAVVLALATFVVGATFAWFTANDHALNKMNTRKLVDGSVEIFENFPDDKLEPGVTLDKEVGAMNTGDVPVFIRMSFEEMLTKLDTPLAGTSTVPVAGRYDTGSGFVPGLMNVAAYGSSSPYDDITTLFPNVTGIPSGVVVKAYYDAANSAYKLVAWKAISATGEFNGAYQKVTLDFDPAADSGDGAVSNVKYVEAAVAAPSNYLWANTFDGSVDVPARIGSEAFTAARPGTDFTGTSIFAKTDDTNEFISLGFSTDLATSKAAGTWWYNTNDGWFYYMGKVNSGTATPFLLSTVSMDKDALNDQLYKYVNFDLDVKMQAIQALEESLTATDGWALHATDDAALITALVDFLV